MSLIAEQSLTFRKREQQPLSKEQELFNKHIKSIEKARKKISAKEDLLNNILALYLEKITPADNAYNEQITAFILALYDILKTEKLSKPEVKKLKAILENKLDNLFYSIVPDDQLKAIYNEVAEVSYEEEEKEQFIQMKEEMEELLSDAFDTNIDLSDLQEGFTEAQLFEKLFELKEKFQQEKEQHQRPRKKTKRELQQEEEEKLKKEFKDKNLRSIYLSLVKLLHPDLETEESEKLQREELMKKVTAAYQENDIHSLLLMEVEIIHNKSENIRQLTDEKLRILNAILKDQLKDLDDQYIMLVNNPRYNAIEAYRYRHTYQAASREIQQQEYETMRLTAFFQEECIYLTGKNRLSYTKSILKTVVRT